MPIRPENKARYPADMPMRRAGTAKRARADMAIRDMIGGE